MDIRTLGEMPPWDWPEDAGATFLRVLTDRGADEADRILAARLAGNACAVNDELAGALLDVLASPDESEALRGSSAIALGPALEQGDTYGFEDPDDVLVTKDVFDRMTGTLRALFRDEGAPKEVRRRVLEAAVRAPQDWHSEAIRAAYASGDGKWRLTAVFCMKYVRGFDDEIAAALTDDAEAVRREALLAAGAWGTEAAWPHVAAILKADDPDKDLLLAAIDAAAGFATAEARDLLGRFVVHGDEDVVSAALDAMAMAGFDADEFDAEDDEEDDEAPPYPPHLLS